jgi:hypothetical protein
MKKRIKKLSREVLYIKGSFILNEFGNIVKSLEENFTQFKEEDFEEGYFSKRKTSITNYYSEKYQYLLNEINFNKFRLDFRQV